SQMNQDRSEGLRHGWDSGCLARPVGATGFGWATLPRAMPWAFAACPVGAQINLPESTGSRSDLIEHAELLANFGKRRGSILGFCSLPRVGAQINCQNPTGFRSDLLDHAEFFANLSKRSRGSIELFRRVRGR